MTVPKGPLVILLGFNGKEMHTNLHPLQNFSGRVE
jgi:hypothetical protein